MPMKMPSGWPIPIAKAWTTWAGVRRPMAPVASLQVLDAGRPAQIADALARGYAKVADLDEGGAPKVLL